MNIHCNIIFETYIKPNITVQSALVKFDETEVRLVFYNIRGYEKVFIWEDFILKGIEGTEPLCEIEFWNDDNDEESWQKIYNCIKERGNGKDKI